MFYFILFYIFIIGLIIGSFLNCLIWRLHTGESLWGRSYCPRCKKKIVWYDNIPLFGYFILRGKCRSCRNNISWQYPLIEFLAGFLFLFSFYLHAKTGFVDIVEVLRSWFIISVMLIVLVYDLRWYLILDKVMFPSMLVVLMLNIVLGVSWISLLISAIIGLAFFLIQFIVSRGAWIGGGDLRLGFFMGLALGNWNLLILSIFLSYLIGSVIGLVLLLSNKKKWGSKMPLGVFLAIGTIITLFFGQVIVNWYFGLF